MERRTQPRHAGSSPHTRGARGADHPADARRRIIPAYAGSTGGGWAWLTIGGGSSPHTRGARAGRGLRLHGDRIIPAYAGSTTSRLPRPLPETDHPRIRGEHGRGALATTDEDGSSPHTRGARRLGRAGVGAVGIIPAYAGSTTRAGRARPAAGDHPRIRGEHAVGFGFDDASVWIIPAYAGST